MKAILFSLIIVFCLFACDSVSDEPFTPNSEIPDAEGFYTISSGDFLLKYKAVSSNTLHCKLSTACSGWVAVGFDNSSRMKDANFIIGYVSNNNTFIRDDFGVSSVSHEADTALGGNSNVTLIAGSESANRTNLEFSIPLNSGDAYDRPMGMGSTYNIIFACSDTDEFDAMHDRYATGSIRIR